ncbi:RagB/SusD family nutrient uptake outer membrane protein [Mucilaginibacter calamicampi]|uniref:RagB/SusD family nutrient uptake outer membrane protein n=1 Tax=Mucilaginibacter calamicampi TaxID=1302352 RepID=A0ABW2YZN8_9SPHI
MKINTKAILITAVVLMSFGVVSCKKYLDRSPAASISDEEAFVNFRNFQGFTEELYYCVPDMSHPDWTGDWNWADEIVPSTTSLNRLSWQFDQGNYLSWTSGASWLNESSANTDPGEGKNKGLWPLAWYGIRKANLGLANLDKLVDATQEEKDIIKGQLLFFRGFFHFELMIYWGGLPYIDRVLPPTEKLELPRLGYRATALLAAKDFEAAAALLPADWDKTTVGQATLNNNQLRVTKSAALAFLGKDYLYAGSPLMNEVSGGPAAYDQEMCKKAADAFVRMLKLSDNGEAVYKLMPFATWSNIWYIVSNPIKIPGYPEVIFGPPVFNASNTPFGIARQYIPAAGGYDGDLGTEAPTANYINNFGMANGLPITDPASGYTTADPWKNRDPRFYKSIITDGERLIQGNGGTLEYRYASLFTNGLLRSESGGSRTGYLERKFTAPGNNKFDGDWDRMAIRMPYIRLGDVYLMYAEAVLQGYGTPQSSFPGYMTAVDAVNVIRNRATVPNIDPKFTVSSQAFMGQLIRERAVELAYEGHRWLDLRRWKLAGNPEYLQKTGAEYDRGPDGKPLNYRERLIITRTFEKKHEWLPLPLSQVNLYPTFGQNPGW